MNFIVCETKKVYRNLRFHENIMLKVFDNAFNRVENMVLTVKEQEPKLVNKLW